MNSTYYDEQEQDDARSTANIDCSAYILSKKVSSEGDAARPLTRVPDLPGMPTRLRASSIKDSARYNTSSTITRDMNNTECQI